MTAKLRRIDEESLRELLSHINNWKQRKAAKEGLLAPLAPMFVLENKEVFNVIFGEIRNFVD